MTHVFVVNEQTFKVHLEYMFAGTGYAENEPNFLYAHKQNTPSGYTEKTLVGMIADISKVRVNDLVVFYVTGCKKFFGFFQIASEPFFELKSTNYLGKELDKYLPFRVKIKPYLVFNKGISEHQALDDLRIVEHPYQMCWSMIYRKLTGLRGCSFLTDYESSNLNLLISSNNKNCLYSENYTYDSIKQEIVKSEEKHLYMGDTSIPLTIRERLLKVSGSFEVHLQSYITQNFDKLPLSKILLPNDVVKCWIGNEVVCSVGEQRIDVLMISETKHNYYIRVCELKYETPSEKIIKEQIGWYIRWIQQYIVPNLNDNKEVKIIPTVIAKKFTRNTQKKQKFEAAISDFNNSNKIAFYNEKIAEVEFIGFERKDTDITFEKVF